MAPINQKYTASWALNCIKANDSVLQWLKSQKSVKYAVLSSPFGIYVAPGSKLMLSNGEMVDGPSHAMKYFKSTLQQLKDLGITPVIVSPTPQNGKDLGRCVAKTSFLQQPRQLCSFDLLVAEGRQQRVFGFLREVQKQAKVIWLADGICTDGKCHAAEGDVIIYRDCGHLSREGSEYVGKKMNLYEAITAQ